MTKQPYVPALPPADLYKKCNPARFSFKTTAELDDMQEIIGQQRAIKAVQFGIGIRRHGYNLFIMGPPGTGKHTVARQFLEQKAVLGQPPSDWCYVNNFDQPHIPRALRLPPGTGTSLRHDIDKVIEDLRLAIPAAFESDEYRTRAQEVEESFKIELPFTP